MNEKNKPILDADLLATVLEDDPRAPYGGTAYAGETLGEFLDSLDLGDNYPTTIEEINDLLRQCYILPIAAADQRNINWRMYIMKSGRPSIDLAIRGRTYAERKQDLREKAIFWQTVEYDYSYGELALWNDYFRENGKRYGLLQEFRENAII